MSTLTEEQRLQFISEIAPLVQYFAPLYGILVCSPIIAQACLECAFGTSYKASFNNYFGLKYRENRVTCNNGYFEDGGSEQNPDGTYTELPSDTAWYSFENMEKGVEGYFQFINIDLYSKLKGVTDPLTYLTYIKEAGYATSIDYVDNVYSYIEKYNLTQYDNPIESRGIKIAIDAGHGSETAGKRHPDGYREHYSDAYMAFYLNQILTKNGFETLKVSWDDDNVTDDEDVALATRQAQILEFGADISVSIHANAYGDGASYNDASGVSTHYHNDETKVGNSVALATAIQEQMVLNTSQNNRGIVAQELAMCNCSAMGTEASVLVETAFMTNEIESELLKSDEFCIECAREIAQGIFNYFEIEDADANVSLLLADRTLTDEETINIASLSGSLDLTEVGFYGAQNCPSPTIKNGDLTLTLNTDYSVSYEDNINAGTGKVICTGLGKYTGTMTLNFTILPMDITDKVSIYCGEKDPETTCYDFSQLEISCMGIDMVKDVDYTMKITEYQDETYDRKIVDITGIGNFTGTGSRDIRVGLLEDEEPVDPEPEIPTDPVDPDPEEPVDPEPEIPTDPEEPEDPEIILIDINTLEFILAETFFEYTGIAHTPEVISDLELDVDYTVSYENNINAGDAKAIITGIGNYTGTLTLEFEIDPISIKDKVSIIIPEPDENGFYSEKDITIESELKEDDDYEVDYYKREVVDEVDGLKYLVLTITVYGIGNYDDEIETNSLKLSLVPTDLSQVKCTLDQTTFTYSGEENKPNVKLEDGDYVLELGSDYIVEYQDNINVGSGKVICTGLNKYTGTIITNITIQPIDISECEITCGASDLDDCYDLKNLRVVLNNIELEEDLEYTYSFTTEQIDYAIYSTVTVKGIGNYSGENTATFKTQKLIINLDETHVSLKETMFEYSGLPIKPIIVTELEEEIDYTAEFTESINHGEYEVIITGIGNYMGTVSLGYLIYQKNINTEDTVISCGEADSDGCYDLNNLSVKINDIELRRSIDYQFSSLEKESSEGQLISTVTIIGIDNYTGSIIKEIKTGQKMIYPGKVVKLKAASIYPRYCSRKASSVKNGNFYLWDNKVINNKIRVTNNVNGIGKLGFITGWVDLDEIILRTSILIGDKVIVNGILNTYADGTGNNITKKNAIMYIVDMLDAGSFKYNYAVASDINRAKQGWASLDMLERIYEED